jgi:RNase H-fold protein (predicted Holliday junction resolvase)
MRIVNLKTFVDELRHFRSNPQAAVRNHILALDIGTKRIGLAKCDLLYFQSFACGTIERKYEVTLDEARRKLTNALQQTIEKEKIVGIVAGFPLMENNDLTPLAQKILSDMKHLNCSYGKDETSQMEAQDLNTAVPVPMMCTFWDERYSSQKARAVIRTKYSSQRSVTDKMRDPLSALMILDDFKQRVLKVR